MGDFANDDDFCVLGILLRLLLLLPLWKYLAGACGNSTMLPVIPTVLVRVRQTLIFF